MCVFLGQRRFTGVPDEDVGAVQWMVSQERLAAKSKQQEKVGAIHHYQFQSILKCTGTSTRVQAQ